MLDPIAEVGKRDPAWWIRRVLGVDLWPKQIEIVEAVRDFDEVAVRSCHGVGKSFLAACVVLWFLYTRKPAVVVTTAPSDRQVRAILWKEIRRLHRDARVPLGGSPTTQKLELAEDHFAWGFTAPDYDPNRFQGWHSEHILAIADEAAGISPLIFEEGINAITTGHNAKLLMIGNPTSPAGDFYSAFGSKHPAAKFKIDAFSTPNFLEFGISLEDVIEGKWKNKITSDLPRPYLVTPAWVEKRLRWGLTSPAFQARVLANFPKQGTQTLIALDWIEHAQEHEPIPASEDRELGVDVARYGGDESVCVLRQGKTARVADAVSGLDTVQLAARVKQLAVDLNVKRIKVDSIGVGAGVYDILRHDDGLRIMMIEVAECVGSAAPEDPNRFLNARAEWFWQLRDMFEAGELSLETDEDLAAQLSNLKYFVMPGGRIRIESKEEMKKRGLPSPDRADAMAYAFATGKTSDFVFI